LRKQEGGDDDDLFSLKLYSQTELKQLSRYILKLKANKSSRFAPTARKLQPKQTEPKLLWQVKKSLAWRYHFGDVPLLPAKLSVTQLTHRGDEYARLEGLERAAFDYSGALERKPNAVLSAGPDLAGPVEGRLIGTATHLVIAQLDLAGSITKEAIEKTKGKLLAEGAMTEAVAEHIETESIITFFESELGRMALNVENVVWCEWPFTFALPASEFTDSSDKRQATSDELIVVQGIIDMLVQSPQGLAVIDFKTDNVNTEQAQERAMVYREQLELYSRAASAILKSKILGKWLYFLTPGCAIEVRK